MMKSNDVTSKFQWCQIFSLRVKPLSIASAYLMGGVLKTFQKEQFPRMYEACLTSSSQDSSQMGLMMRPFGYKFRELITKLYALFSSEL